MSDALVGFDPDDPKMAEAIGVAKETLGEFLDALSQPKIGQTGFLLKVVFDTDGQREHVWVAEVEVLSARTLCGVIASTPKSPNLRFKQRVDFEPNRITDWMYVENGLLVGGFTTRLIRKRMTSEERAAFDASVPYRFES
jgi:uncharacterized protein YegJ (DUF2314 family)